MAICAIFTTGFAQIDDDDTFDQLKYWWGGLSKELRMNLNEWDSKMKTELDKGPDTFDKMPGSGDIRRGKKQIVDVVERTYNEVIPKAKKYVKRADKILKRIGNSKAVKRLAANKQKLMNRVVRGYAESLKVMQNVAKNVQKKMGPKMRRKEEEKKVMMAKMRSLQRNAVRGMGIVRTATVRFMEEVMREVEKRGRGPR